MHYKNGREAREGDPVVGKSFNGQPVVGILIDTTAALECCNGTVVRPLGLPLSCVNVKDFYHAEDAFAALEQKQPTPDSAPTK